MHIISTVQIQLGTNAVIQPFPKWKKENRNAAESHKMYRERQWQCQSVPLPVKPDPEQLSRMQGRTFSQDEPVLPLQPAATTGHSRSHWGNLKSLLLFVPYLKQGGILLPPLSVPSRLLVKHLCSVSPSFSEDPWLIKNRSIVQGTGSVLC